MSFSKKADDPPGFKLSSLSHYDDKQKFITHHEVYLPASSESELSEESERRAAQIEVQAIEAAREAVRIKDELEERLDAKKLRTPGHWPPSFAKKKDLSFEEEAAELRLRALLDEPSEEDGLTVPIYKWDEPLKLISERSADRDLKSFHKSVFKSLGKMGHRRPLAEPDIDHIEWLTDQHPNFREVISFIAGRVKLCKRQSVPVRIPPILLTGEPGVGKTHFSKNLADWLKTTVHRIGFDSNYSSSSILGSDKNWGNTQPGLIFNAVCLGTTANPVILLDEIDKARYGSGYQSPTASLHSLLEPVTSAAVRDISLDFDFDASWVIYVATCNHALLVDASLRSRFTEFHIKLPQGEEALQLTRVMIEATHEKMDLIGFSMPGRSFVRLIAHLTAREQRQALEHAYASAVADGRMALEKEDLPAEVLLDNQVEVPGPKRKTKADEPSGWIH